jgi:hypothetical protein
MLDLLIKGGTVVIASVIALGMATPAGAACRWSQDCTSGTCQPVPLCDHVYDVPGAMSGDAMVPRIVPPSIAPIMTPVVPPPGASHCVQRNICNFGHCGWQPVCQ